MLTNEERMKRPYYFHTGYDYIAAVRIDDFNLSAQIQFYEGVIDSSTKIVTRLKKAQTTNLLKGVHQK